MSHPVHVGHQSERRRYSVIFILDRKPGSTNSDLLKTQVRFWLFAGMFDRLTAFRPGDQASF